MAFRLKMNSLVYIHPDNEFFAQDTDSKVPIALGTNEFITVSHDVTHSLPRNTMEGVIQKTSCRDDFVYDDCVRDVSYSSKVASTNASRFEAHLVYKHTQNANFLNRSSS